MLTGTSAYQKGWDASYNTKTADMEAAESRFLDRFGSRYQDQWESGWIDYASGYQKWSSYRDPEGRMTQRQVRDLLQRAAEGLEWAHVALAEGNLSDFREAMVEVTGAAAEVQDAAENDGIEGCE